MGRWTQKATGNGALRSLLTCPLKLNGKKDKRACIAPLDIGTTMEAQITSTGLGCQVVFALGVQSRYKVSPVRRIKIFVPTARELLGYSSYNEALPEATSQSRAVWSTGPVASVRPSGRGTDRAGQGGHPGLSSHCTLVQGRAGRYFSGLHPGPG